MNTSPAAVRSSRRLLSVLAFAALPACLSPAAHGSVVFFSPTAVTATNTSVPTATAIAAGNLIDLSGLSNPVVTLANIGSVVHSDGVPTDGWRGDESALPITLTFDFAGLVDVEYVGLWQYFSDREGTAGFSLTFFDGAAGTGNAIGGVYNAILDPVGIAQGTIPLNGRSFDVGLRSGVQSIAMQINTIAREVNPFVHLGEFMVGATPIPEPDTAAMMALALTLAGTAFTRRRPEHGARAPLFGRAASGMKRMGDPNP